MFKDRKAAENTRPVLWGEKRNGRGGSSPHHETTKKYLLGTQTKQFSKHNKPCPSGKKEPGIQISGSTCPGTGPKRDSNNNKKERQERPVAARTDSFIKKQSTNLFQQEKREDPKRK